MGILDRLGRDYQVTRFAAGTFFQGKWTDGPIESEWIMTASIQPLTAYEQANQPDGIRTREMVKIYTRFALQVAREDLQVRGDRFQFCGKTFEVIKIANWGMEAGANGEVFHFKAIAALVEESPRGN